MTVAAIPEIGKTVTADGIATNYLEAGTSGDPVVFAGG